ncbi:MAG: hypothetical protein V1898_05335 [Patescibacteria group bacterium]
MTSERLPKQPFPRSQEADDSERERVIRNELLDILTQLRGIVDDPSQDELRTSLQARRQELMELFEPINERKRQEVARLEKDLHRPLDEDAY